MTSVRSGVAFAPWRGFGRSVDHSVTNSKGGLAASRPRKGPRQLFWRRPTPLGVERLECRLLLDRGLELGMEFPEMIPTIITADPPANHATFPGGEFGGVKLDGVADLLIFTKRATFRCSGSLLSTGRHVLTAAHCVPPESQSATATFHLPAFSESVQVTRLFVHPSYSAPRLRNDIAILELASAPSSAADRYGIYRSADEIGQVGVKSGYGRGGVGETGDTLASGRKRWGRNVYDRVAAGGTQLLYDFDNGQASNNPLGGLGLGDDEVNSAAGDSGGPTLIGGLVAGVASYNTRNRFDIDQVVNSSFGEISGDTRVSAYAEWIDDVLGVQVESPPTEGPTIAATYFLSTAHPGAMTNSDGTSVSFDDSDVLRLEIDEQDQFRYSVFFDGSDFGLDDDTEDIDALHVLGNRDLIISTTGLVEVPGVRGQGQDLLFFDGTTQSWSLVLDGSQVGLSSPWQNIDAVSVVDQSDGASSFLLSTRDRPGAPGLLGKSLEQSLLLFDRESQSWDVFVDGSDVGLRGVDENINAIHLGSSSDVAILLSARGNFAVPGLAGSNEDVARLKLIVSGPTTVGNFDSQLALDGRNYGLGSFDLDALYVPVSGDVISDRLLVDLLPFSPLLVPKDMAGPLGVLQASDIDEPDVHWHEEPGGHLDLVHPVECTGVPLEPACAARGRGSADGAGDTDELFLLWEDELDLETRLDRLCLIAPRTTRGFA